MHKKIAFEGEFIIGNHRGETVNKINGIQANKAIIEEILSDSKHRKFCSALKPELDACQIEITNIGAKDTFSEAQDEVLEMLEIVIGASKKLGVQLLKQSTPPSNYIPETSITGKTEDDTRYTHISNILSKYNVRKSTNITGIHMHIDTDDDLEGHKNLCDRVRYILDNNSLETLGMSQERYYHMQRVVQALQESGTFDINNPLHHLIPLKLSENSNQREEQLIGVDGKPYFGYNLVSLKSPSNGVLTSELRSFDAIGCINDFEKKIGKIYNFTLEALK